MKPMSLSYFWLCGTREMLQEFDQSCETESLGDTDQWGAEAGGSQVVFGIEFAQKGKSTG